MIEEAPNLNLNPWPKSRRRGARKAETKANKEFEKARRQAEREVADAAKNKDDVALDAAREHFDGTPRRPMVKWVASTKPESFVSCRVADYGLAMQTSTMLTHLDNIVMHKRSPVQQAITDIRAEMKELFRSHRFKQFKPPSLIGAASEGGVNVFSMPYFDKQAKAQSPQFYKQIEVAGGRKRVFSIGPVLRAENLNTAPLPPSSNAKQFTGLDLEMEIYDGCREVFLMLDEELQLPEIGDEVRLSFGEGRRLLREGTIGVPNVSDDEDMITPEERASRYTFIAVVQNVRRFGVSQDPPSSDVICKSCILAARSFWLRGA
ncbi:tRNA synthetases class II-domain-containing protein [Nemania serpens]|nr:tRNA synthetases class II-domain-containing protein [Nemania serpens]